MIDLNFLLHSLDINADWMGLRHVSDKVLTHQSKNGQTDPMVTSYDEGLMIEVLYEGQFASMGIQDFSISCVQQAAQQALDCAKRFKKYQLNSFNTSVRPPSQGQYQSQGNHFSLSSHHQDMGDLTRKLSCELKQSDRIINTNAMLVSIHQETTFVSTNGADFCQDIHQHALCLSATAQERSVIQTRSNGFPLIQGGFEFFQDSRWFEETKQIAHEAIELTQADDCPEGLYDVILMPDQMHLQIHESIGHPLELDRILGDERNYAGWSFVKLEDFGHLQYGSPLLNITFDPRLPDELTSYQFDDTGVPAEHHYLIKNGLLKRGIGSLESQQRSGVPGIASTRASSWNRLPIDRMANINLEPGTSTLEEMISATERGILMKTNKSWSIDDYRHKFQFGCEYGQLIQNGKIVKTLKNPNYRGISTPFWQSLKMVGDSSTFDVHGTLMCGKGEPNQVARVGHASPPCLFTNVAVFGGGK